MQNDGGEGEAFAQGLPPRSGSDLLRAGCGLRGGCRRARAAGRRSPEPIEDVLEGSPQGHGNISVGYLNHLVNGSRGADGNVGTSFSVRSQSIALSVDYNITDRWSMHAEIPYIVNRFQGPNPHCPTAAPPQCAHIPALNTPHPESQFLDDGSYHGDLAGLDVGRSVQRRLRRLFRYAVCDCLSPQPRLHVLFPSRCRVRLAAGRIGRHARAPVRFHAALLPRRLWPCVCGGDVGPEYRPQQSRSRTRIFS